MIKNFFLILFLENFFQLVDAIKTTTFYLDAIKIQLRPLFLALYKAWSA